VLDDVDGNDYDENLSGNFFQVFHNEFIKKIKMLMKKKIL